MANDTLMTIVYMKVWFMSINWRQYIVQKVEWNWLTMLFKRYDEKNRLMYAKLSQPM